jgi:hypothetical protein
LYFVPGVYKRGRDGEERRRCRFWQTTGEKMWSSYQAELWAVVVALRALPSSAELHFKNSSPESGNTPRKTLIMINLFTLISTWLHSQLIKGLSPPLAPPSYYCRTYSTQYSG